MNPVTTAFLRAFASLRQPSILWHLTWPVLVSGLVWLALGFSFLSVLAEATLAWFQSIGWLQDWLSGSQWVAAVVLVTAKLLLILLALPLMYVTTSLIVAAVALPMMLTRVAAMDYPELERRKGGSIAGSVWNAIVAVFWYLLWLALTLPLWLIPGLALVLPWVLSAYLNRRAYRYDALMEHADAEEMRTLFASEHTRLFWVGLGAGALAYVPLVNFFAPAYAGLAYVHYCLEALRQRRGLPVLAN